MQQHFQRLISQLERLEVQRDWWKPSSGRSSRNSRAKKKIQGSFEEWQKRDTFSAATDDLFYGGYHSQVNMAVQKRLTAEADRLGINSDDVNFGQNIFGGRVERIAGEHHLAGLAQKIEAKGGNVLQDAAEMMLRAAQLMVDAQKKSERTPPVPRAFPPGPTPVPRR